jgi:hypothetical protein
MRSFIDWTDIDGELSKETLIAKINGLISSLELGSSLKMLAEISHFIFKNADKDETVLRKKLLGTRLLNYISKYEQQNGASIIFHKQPLLKIEQIIVGINSKSIKSNSIKPELIGKLFLYVNSLIEKIDYPLEEPIVNSIENFTY